jgi:hypothetical protein
MSEPIRFGGPISMSDNKAFMEVHMRVFGHFEGTLAKPEAQPWLSQAIMRALTMTGGTWGVGAMKLSNPQTFPEWASRAQQEVAPKLAEVGAVGQIVIDMVTIDPDDLEKMQANMAKAAQNRAPAAPAAPFAPGSSVLVQWSDGNRYPGTVRNIEGGRTLIAFPNGREEWVPSEYLSPA